MDIDKTRGDDMALGIDLLAARAGDLSHSHDGVAVDGYVTANRLGATTVHDGAAADNQIMCHVTLPRAYCCRIGDRPRCGQSPLP